MSKRTLGSSSGKKAENLGLQKEDVLQAVVICDSFNNEFAPLTLQTSTALIPLVNTPLLDYTLEFLAAAGVQEAILFCVNHADAIKNYIRQGRWSTPTSPIVVTIIVSEGCRSMGDAMRDIDGKALIRSDFILLTGHTVANFDLLPIMEKHKTIQKQDKGAVMTLIYKSASPGHRARHPGDETLLAVHSTSGRILFHQKVGRRSKKLTFPLELFLDNASVDLRYDVLDSGICICSPAVPPLFSDNFDFQTRDDFVRGLLLNEEILASTLYYHQLRGTQYAVQASSWHMYQIASHDVIHRWTYPCVPDMPLTDSSEPYMFMRQNIYRQKIKLAKGSVLQEDVVIGEGSTVGENSQITHSIIGKNCHIGRNTIIRDSFLWDNTTVQNECFIRDTVVAGNCTLGNRVSLTTGCIVAPGVNLEQGIQLENLHVVSSPPSDDTSLYEQQQDFQKVADNAWACRPTSADGESEVVAVNGLYLGSDGEDTLDGSVSSGSSDDLSHRDSPVPDDTNLFYHEVIDSLHRGYEDRLACDNLILEINSSRYAYNVSVKEVNFHVVKAILNLPQGPDNYLACLVKQLSYFLPILGNYIKRSDDAQVDCLQAIEEVAESRVEVRDGLPKLLHLLYDKDILEEPILLQWFNTPNPDLPSSTLLRQQVAPFIKWLQEADEETDSEESE